VPQPITPPRAPLNYDATVNNNNNNNNKNHIWATQVPRNRKIPVTSKDRQDDYKEKQNNMYSVKDMRTAEHK
jgi:hypothetical protein